MRIDSNDLEDLAVFARISLRLILPKLTNLLNWSSQACSYARQQLRYRSLQTWIRTRTQINRYPCWDRQQTSATVSKKRTRRERGVMETLTTRLKSETRRNSSGLIVQVAEEKDKTRLEMKKFGSARHSSFHSTQRASIGLTRMTSMTTRQTMRMIGSRLGLFRSLIDLSLLWVAVVLPLSNNCLTRGKLLYYHTCLRPRLATKQHEQLNQNWRKRKKRSKLRANLGSLMSTAPRKKNRRTRKVKMWA